MSQRRVILHSLLCSALLWPLATEAKTVEVKISGMQFVPAEVEAKAGDEVVWRNEDLVPHTVTTTKKLIDSGSIAAGASFSVTVKKKGQHAYKCLFHPTMTGVLIVR